MGSHRKPNGSLRARWHGTEPPIILSGAEKLLVKIITGNKDRHPTEASTKRKCNQRTLSATGGDDFSKGICAGMGREGEEKRVNKRLHEGSAGIKKRVRGNGSMDRPESM